MKVLYLTSDGIQLAENGKSVPLPSYRVQQYKATIDQIHQNKAWKTSGKGAMFMGTYEEDKKPEAKASFCGLALYQEEFLYTLQLDASGGLYKRSFSEKAEMEGHICSGNDVRLGEIACHGDDVAACVRYPDGRSHIGLYHLPASYCTEITDGDSCESSPSWSPDGRTLYFSTAGIARNERGNAAAYAPRAIVAYHVNSEQMEMVLEDEQFDLLSPKEDADGNLWYIRQPYRMSDEDDRNSLLGVLKDVVLFPYRIIKGLFGFLNAFTTLFGGEPLRNGGKRSDVKSKQKSDKELFFEGNLIKAEKNQKENARSGEEYPGILPRNRVLVKKASDGNEEIIAKGVLDFALCKDGVVYSNGSHILHKSGSEKPVSIAKTRLAAHLQVVEE